MKGGGTFKIFEDLNKSKNIDIIKTENNKIYAKVLNFEGSKEFGSSQWCISTHQDNYDEYLKKDYIDLIKDRNNYIILDFAHLFYYSFDKSIIGDHYDNFETYEDNNINSIYFGFDKLIL